MLHQFIVTNITSAIYEAITGFKLCKILKHASINFTVSIHHARKTAITRSGNPINQLR